MTNWITPDARTFLSRGYLPEGVTVEQRIRQIAERAEAILGFKGYADKLEDYALKGWISFSSPVWSNFGTEFGLPISCNGSYFPDDTIGIFDKYGEIGIQTKHGAGTSGYIGALRPRGAKISRGGVSDGPVSFLGPLDAIIATISQTGVRRGSFAAYLNIDHPDIEEFLEIREEGHPIQNILIGVTIPDDWMLSMLEGDKAKRKIWARILRKRFETGLPYIMWSDNANNAKPDWYKEYTIWASNLCTEIMEPSKEDWSFVCCLSSVNLYRYDEWKYTDLVQVVTYLLDAVMTEYIDKTAGIKYLEASHKFAVENRALGLGVLGYAEYLQAHSYPFESKETRAFNIEVFKHLDKESRIASEKLAFIFGEPLVMKGTGYRNATRLALAPTKSSSFILGTSQSIEPIESNYFVPDLAKGKFTYRNPHLKVVLAKYGKDTFEVWDSILDKDGSVQHLTFLSEHEKNVFKTFGEISQAEIIMQAAARQPYIDQGQSINLKIHPDAPSKDVSDLYIMAWKLGLKSLYYQYSTNPAQELTRSLLDCAACEA